MVSNIGLEISFPLDEDKCLRRECPLCGHEFKVQFTQNELETFLQRSAKNFLVTSNSDENSEMEQDQEYYCPYCGQSSPASSWWTQEQVSYIETYLKNILAQTINENLIGPLNRSMGHGQFISFKGEEMELETPWISPEQNDMVVRELQCCSRLIKMDETWQDKFYCFFCGFSHDSKKKNEPETI